MSAAPAGRASPSRPGWGVAARRYSSSRPGVLAASPKPLYDLVEARQVEDAMTEIDYGLFDCDTHCYETRDAFTRYLPKEWMEYAIAPVKLPDGSERVMA